MGRAVGEIVEIARARAVGPDGSVRREYLYPGPEGDVLWSVPGGGKMRDEEKLFLVEKFKESLK